MADRCGRYRYFLPNKVFPGRSSVFAVNEFVQYRNTQGYHSLPYFLYFTGAGLIVVAGYARDLQITAADERNSYSF